MAVVIRSSLEDDIYVLVSLSRVKRLSYEKAQPQFWRYAGMEAEISQAKWFKELLRREDYIMLTTEHQKKIIGFVIGRLVPAPEVYNPGRLTLIIDDFVLENEGLWLSVGDKLISEIKIKAKNKGATQILVVSGAHDNPKRTFLTSIGLSCASEWYVGSII